MRRAPAILLVTLLSILAAGCGGSSNKAATDTTATAASGSCDKGSLKLVNSGQLTVGTDNPAYPPWFGGNEKAPWKVSDPRSGQGFESAVAYAVAKQLGFATSEVKWIVVPFNTSYAPGPKKFDFDINEISFTPARAKVVDFSDSYYDVNQAVVVEKGTKIASATLDRRPEALQARRADRHHELPASSRTPSSRRSSRPSSTRTTPPSPR